MIGSTTKDQREEKFRLQNGSAQKTANTGIVPPSVTDFGINPGFHIENSLLGVQKEQETYTQIANSLSEKALNEELLGNYPDSRYLWQQAAAMSREAEEYGKLASVYEMTLQPPTGRSIWGTAPKPTGTGSAPKPTATGTAPKDSIQAAQTVPGAFTGTKATPVSANYSELTLPSWEGTLDAYGEEAETKGAKAADYVKRSLEQIILGNYTDEVTLGGTLTQLGLSLLGVDIPFDLRDAFYDWTHLKESPISQTLIDTIALLPLVGAIKPAIKVTEAGADLAKAADKVTDAAKAAEPLTDAEKARRKAEIMAAIDEQVKKSGADGNAQQILDPKWYEEYNEVKEKFDKAAEKAIAAGDGEYVTYYRVQTPGPSGSYERILVNDDQTISIRTSDKNLNISAYTTDHAKGFATTGKRADGSYVVAVDVPVWFDEIIRENAILQRGSRTNPLNKVGISPKITDTTTAGYKYELPEFWNKWLEEYAINARKLDIGELP